MIVMSERYLYSNWSTEKKIKLRGKSYRVGKMNYGDYFLEPGQPGKETQGFNPGTLWPEKFINSLGQVNYKV